MADRIDVPLELADFEVISSELVAGVLEVEVRCTRRPACHHCGSLDVSGHGRHERRVRDRACSYPTLLRWHQRRLRCKDCGATFRERHSAIAGRKRLTERFRRQLFEQAVDRPFTDVATQERVSWYRVVEAFEHHAAAALVTEPPSPPRALSIDESAFRKRFRFHTVVSDPEQGVILDLVEGRHRGAAQDGLLALSDQVRAGIETVVIDCHWPYRRAIEEALPQARVVADKFHVLRAIDNAAARVRKRHGRRRLVRGRDGGIARQQNPRFIPAVWRNRWTFMKRAHKLSAPERDALRAIFEELPEIGVAWLMKEAFAAIYEAPDRGEAERRLDVWVSHLEVAGLDELKGVWRTLQWWREPILAYFDDPITNAFAEGVTNKIKVMKRRSYGFRDPVRYRQKVLLSCRRRRSRAG